MLHELKLELAFLKPIYNGQKTFEIRKNDRGFQKGDLVRFKAVDKLGLHMHSKLDEMEFEITYVLSGWGLEPGFVAFGIRPFPGCHLPPCLLEREGEE